EPGAGQFVVPQYRQAVQTEVANLDPRVRAALYQAVDREALTEHEVPAWGLLPPGAPFYDATKDAFRPFAYNPDRARAELADLGWTSGVDGLLHSTTDGRVYHNTLWTIAGNLQQPMSVFADYWRQIGVQVDEYTIPAALTRDAEYRASYPSWEISAAAIGEPYSPRLQGPAATAENHWVGNRGGYDDPRAQALVRAYVSSLSDEDQFNALRALSDFYVSELPLLPFYFNIDLIGVRKGVQALDDADGGSEPVSPPYGTYTRNAFLWDLS